MFESVKISDIQQQIIDVLPVAPVPPEDDDDRWAGRADVVAAMAASGIAAKTIGNNLAKLVTAGVVQKAAGAENGLALYRVSAAYAEWHGRLGQEPDIAEDNGDEPGGVFAERDAGWIDGTDDDVPAPMGARWEHNNCDRCLYDRHCRDHCPDDCEHRADPEPHIHEWVAGIAIVADEDVEQVAAVRPVKCSQCDEPYRLTTDPMADDRCAESDRPVHECECEYHGGPIHTGAATETAPEQSETGGVVRSAPVPAPPVSDDLNAVAAFMQAVRPVSAPPAAPERKRRTAGDRPAPEYRVFANGELNAEIVRWLAEQPAGTDYSPTQIGKALNAQVGSVAFACERGVSAGTVLRTQAKPKRYAVYVPAA